ncbi:hypothetical protein AC482_01470 [miscellaneous Crenarchaeota group-15 archaeon DG-45]|uniref:Uncharacterized protein n=1 Tax=miscellaneous Crenarchaeota group-15 archaeon DG-45 TaxID=1685127 RepID=A0A0M0BS31_9ARCH|nr:MAG: hypothetical protein AC482_01470 [miscellaneous Crenarchaeota group-15 archaeon DG-45]
MNGAEKGDQPVFNTDREEFIRLTQRMVEVMVDFCLLTLQAVSKKKEAPLNSKEIEKIIDFDLSFRIQQIQDPEIQEIVRERAASEFRKIQNKFY